jgi:indole-3-glycerol phosphate synthase
LGGFLEQMAAGSRRRLAEGMAREPLGALRSRCADLPPPPPLRLSGDFDVIAELKLRSPALGQLAATDADLETRVRSYASAGAAAVSVLTEPDRFDGSLAHLAAATAALGPLGVPAMRKDFLVDPYQLYEARAAGAGGALLIVRMLSRPALTEMLECAAELGLFALIETFDADDVEVASEVLDAAAATGLALVGVNSRDLQTLEVATGRLAALAPRLPRDRPRVAESGLRTPGDAAAVVRVGYDVALVGGALMSAADPAALLGEMLAAGRRAAA